MIRLPIVLVVSLVSVLFKILLSPAELLLGVFQRSTSMIIWAIPSIILLVGAGYYLYAQPGDFDRQEKIQQCLLTANQKFGLGSFEACVDSYTKLLEMEVALSDEDRFQFSKALHKVGRDPEAKKIFDELAPLPGKGTGFPPAHQLAAANIAKSSPRPISEKVRTILKWHLDNGGEPKSPEVERAWAEYYLSIGDNKSALEHMKKAASAQPEYILLVISILRDSNDLVEYKAALNQAREIFQSRVRDYPALVDPRIILSNVLVELDQLPAAEQTLKAGLVHSNSRKLKSALAAYYVQRFQANKSSSRVEFETKFELVRKALTYDENHVPAYESLIQLHLDQNEEEESRSAVLDTLKRMIETSQQPALAHFALSNILWNSKQEDESRVHMEKAFQLDPQKFAVIANNLAWILAHSDQPDLDRAYEISRQVCDKYPHDGRLRDTLATVLKEQNRYQEALAEFSKALPTVTSKPKVHAKMAEIYDAIGNEEFAELHRKKARQE